MSAEKRAAEYSPVVAGHLVLALRSSQHRKNGLNLVRGRCDQAFETSLIPWAALSPRRLLEGDLVIILPRAARIVWINAGLKLGMGAFPQLRRCFPTILAHRKAKAS